jgi:hypothetical protein
MSFVGAGALAQRSQPVAKTPAPGKCGAGANARSIATLGKRPTGAACLHARQLASARHMAANFARPLEPAPDANL